MNEDVGLQPLHQVLHLGRTAIDLPVGRPTKQMIDAVNGTALNLSKSFALMWGNISNRPAGLDDGDDNTWNTSSEMLAAVTGTKVNAKWCVWDSNANTIEKNGIRYSTKTEQR